MSREPIRRCSVRPVRRPAAGPRGSTTSPSRQLGGIRGEINYTRQWDEVNQARSGKDTIYTFEDLMADGITEDGSSFSYVTRVTWGEEQPSGVGPEHDSEPWEYVPESYDVRVHEDGEQILESHLPNYLEGARFPG